jgi:predicted ATP-grasp superfamily ATP-dependent carboligase
VPSRTRRIPRHLDRVDVAVLDADQRQSLVCIRSLGRAGLRVGAFDSCRAAAFGSRWCTLSGLLPNGARDADLYVAQVMEIVDRHAPKVLIVASDETVETLRARRAEVERHTTLALAPNAAVDVAVDKDRTLAVAESLGIPVPRTVPVRDAIDIRAAVREVGFPAVVKPVKSWLEQDGSGIRLRPQVVLDVEELRAAAEPSFAGGASVLVQQWIPGRREAIWLLQADGRSWARFAQVAHRMYPALGGSSVFRESIPVPEDSGTAAEALVAAIGLTGYSEIEFRRDSENRAVLMEINPRISASLEVAVRAGVDFPALIYAWATGGRLTDMNEYRYGVKVRWLGGDVRWLRETLANQGRPDIMRRRKALRTFFGDFFIRSFYDYVEPKDIRPAFTASTVFAARSATRSVAGFHNERRDHRRA